MVPGATLNPTPDSGQRSFRVYAFKDVVRFARRFRISVEELRDVVQSRADAELGGGLYKFRIARPGEGSRGGGRVLVALKLEARAILMFAWEKKDQENIRPSEVKAFRDAAKLYLAYSNEQMDMLVKNDVIVEIRPTQEGETNAQDL